MTIRSELDTARRRRGEVFGDKYVLGDVLGIGGMGIVYLASQQCLDRTVVVKVLRPALLGNPQMLRRFRDEALAGSRLSHRNIAVVIDFGVTPDGDQFLVMERVRGQPLSRLITQPEPLSLPRVIGIATQILAALAEAHGAGIIHADVKSDNVLVETARDGAELSKLIDFGLARFVGGAKEVNEHLLSGTPEYIAPEVVEGHPPSPSSDLYAVGVILYELLTGATPFAGGTCEEILTRHRDDEVVPPSLRCPERTIPLELERIVLRALQKSPTARFTTAIAFAEALAKVPTQPGALALRTAAIVSLPFSTEAPTQHTPRRRFPVGTPAVITEPTIGTRSSAESPAVVAARAIVGEAIVRGDIDLVVAAYLELARALIDDHQLPAAATSLEEGIDFLTVGGFGEAPEPTWRLMLSLSALYAGIGDPIRARRTAIAGRDHAASVQSAIGQDRAHALLHRLVRGHGLAAE